MKKLIIILTVLIVMQLQPLRASEWEIYINGGYSTEFTFPATTYKWIWGEEWIDIEERGSIKGHGEKSTVFSAGIQHFLSDEFGLAFGVEYKRSQVVLDSEYQMNLEWFDGETESQGKSWQNEGMVDVIPFSFNLIYRVQFTEHTFFNLTGGLTMSFVKIKLNSHVGYADILEDEYYYYRDWFDLPVNSTKNYFSVGFNVGVDLEQKISDLVGLNMGVRYTYFSDIYSSWEVVARDEFVGENDILIYDGAPDIHADSRITKTLRLSYLRAFVGIKLYL